MTVEFRYAALDDYGRISSFVDNYWAKDHVYVRLPKLFDWTFGRRGLWDRDGYSFALAEDKGEIVGILGGIPFSFNCFGKSSRGAWLANYMVRPDYRRGSVGIRLLNMFRRPPYETVVAFGVVPSAIPLYQLLRWRILDDIPRHIMVLPEAEHRMARLLMLARPDWSEDRAAALVRFFRLTKTPVAVDETRLSAYLRNPPPDWDKHDWAAISSHTVGGSRDLDYLTWRYIKHPVFDYRFIGVSEGSRTGLLVWRVETIRRATPHGVVEVDRLGRVLEFLPASARNAQQLLAVFTHELSEMKALGADYYGYHSKTRRYLEEFGFRSTGAHPDGPFVPSRFQPLDQRCGQIRSAISVQDETPTCTFASDCSWYWTKSDADQDRPN